MGQLAVAVAGGIIGAFFGMPQLGFLAGSLIGSLIFNKSGGSGKGGPKLADLHVTGSTYGKAIQIGWGTLRIGGNIIWSGDLVQHKVSQGGGKGMGGGTSYTYSWTGAVGLCGTDATGPIDKVLKIWADTKLVYDATGESGITKNIPAGGGGGGGGKGGGHHGSGAPVVNGGVANAFNTIGTFRVLTGTQDQMPDPALETLVGAANAQAHRGMAYIVFDDINLENFGNRVPNFTMEVVFNSDTGNQYSQNAFKFNFDTSVLAYPDNSIPAIDAFRHRAYFFKSGTGADTTKGIFAMDLKTGNQVSDSSWSRTFAGNSARSFTGIGSIVADDGYLWVWSQEANYGPYVKIDPLTLREVGHIGSPHPTMSLGGSTTAPQYVVPMRLSHDSCLLVAGQVFGDLHLLDLTTMGPIAASGWVGGAFRMCAGLQIDNDNAGAFGLVTPASFGGGSTTPFEVYAITASGPQAMGGAGIAQTLIATIHPADIDTLWTHFNQVSYFVADATDGNVMFFVGTSDLIGTTNHHRQYLVKVNGVTGEIMWKTPFENSPQSSETLPGFPDNGSFQSMITTGVFSVLDGHDKVWTFNTQDGSATQATWPHLTNTDLQIWNDTFGAILIHGVAHPTWDANNTFGIIVTNAAGNSRGLGIIVGEICNMVGLSDADFDVSALTDEVPGYLLTGQMTAQAALAPLATAYLFDGVESDDIIKFVKRGGSPIATIPSTDLSYIDKKTNTLIQETRSQEIDLPREVGINFLDPTRDYQSSTQYARRATTPYPSMYSKTFHTEDLPIAADPGTMKQLAEKLLFTMWIERVAFKVHLPWTYLKYDPTDVLTLTSQDGATTPVRMTTNAVGADFSMEWSAVAQSTTSYTSTASSEAGQGFVTQQFTVPTPTKLFLLDMPLLRDQDDTGQSFTVLYDAAAGYGETWKGCVVLRSTDDTIFNTENTFSATQQVAWGVTNNALGDTSNPFTPDYVNTLTVTMTDEASHLTSASLTDVCNGSNAAAVYNPSTGVIEIIQFTTVTANVDGSYTLSGLLRGRRGTDVYTGAHVSGELFILLESSSVQNMNMALGDLNTTRYFKGTTNGDLVENSDSVVFTDTGRALKPYAPASVSATLSGSDINLAWVRRTRVGGELASYTGVVPLAEQSEIYEVDIYDAGGVTVLRTLRVEYGATPTTSPGVTYTAAEIAADFGSTPTSLIMAVYQISTVIGRGFGKKQTVTVN